jgi:hypothetical protein
MTQTAVATKRYKIVVESTETSYINYDITAIIEAPADLDINNLIIEENGEQVPASLEEFIGSEIDGWSGPGFDRASKLPLKLISYDKECNCDSNGDSDYTLKDVEPVND